MAAQLPPNHDVHDADRDALAWLQVRLGSAPLVPPDVRDTGDPHRIIAAALAQLQTLSVRVAPTPARFRDSRGVYLPPKTPTSRARNPEPQHTD
jgi:hypothetical protein